MPSCLPVLVIGSSVSKIVDDDAAVVRGQIVNLELAPLCLRRRLIVMAVLSRRRYVGYEAVHLQTDAIGKEVVHVMVTHRCKLLQHVIADEDFIVTPDFAFASYA